MSHLKSRLTPISMRFAPSNALIALTLSSALSIGSGCAMVQVPSYRLEECATESYCNEPVIVPTLPMPGWLARWKAEKDLPKPPVAPRFHPLPTRPMFQPNPTPDFGVPGEAACYGTLPPAESWNGVSSATAAQVPVLANPR